MVEVAKPYLGENRPSRVRADITLTLDVPEHVKQEWEGNNIYNPTIRNITCTILALRKHDVCLLMAIRPKMSLEENFNTSQNFAEQVHISLPILIVIRERRKHPHSLGEQDIEPSHIFHHFFIHLLR